MILESILKNIEHTCIVGSSDVDIKNICIDSRKLESGDVFVCIKGANFDSHEIIGQVILDGAKAIIIDREDILQKLNIKNIDTSIVKVKDTKKALSILASNYYDSPKDKIKLIGITGTKGKTTVAYMVYESLKKMGKKVGLIGTIEIITASQRVSSVNTTPDALSLQKIFSQMVEEELEYVVMEVSSQAYLLDRVYGIKFDIGVFTNLSKDHIGKGEHNDMDNYIGCKSMLFKNCKIGIGNIDDDNFERIFKDSNCKTITYGINKKADYKAKNITLVKDIGLGASYEVEGRKKAHVRINNIGRFNIYNSLCAIAICDSLGLDISQTLEAIKDIKVKGRLERVNVDGDYTLLIDYAHNKASLENLLSSIREYNPKRLVCLFGCGGDRDKNRRFEMGEVAGNLADFTIITSDNPRTEKPLAIINDIEIGIKKTSGKYIKIENRKEAIRYAIKNAKKDDVIVLAGKGHEDYQIVGTKKYPFDEREIIKDIFEGK